MQITHTPLLVRCAFAKQMKTRHCGDYQKSRVLHTNRIYRSVVSEIPIALQSPFPPSQRLCEGWQAAKKDCIAPLHTHTPIAPGGGLAALPPWPPQRKFLTIGSLRQLALPTSLAQGVFAERSLNRGEPIGQVAWHG